MSKKIDLHRDIVARCHCGGDLWYILVDKPAFEEIKGIQCSFCAEIIEFEIKSPQPAKVEGT